MTIVEPTRLITGGVDTHLDTHTAVAVDHLGGQLGVETFPADAGGYEDLLDWLTSFGEVDAVGVEGTGSYGAGLRRYLLAHDVVVVEVDRPNRQTRHRVGKSDPTDALAAARAVIAGIATGIAKTGTGPVEAMRVLGVARRSARSHRIETICQIRHLVITGPEPLRARLRGLSTIMIVKTAAAMRPRHTGDIAADTTTRVIVDLARRARHLEETLDNIDRHLNELVAGHAPELIARPGIGPVTAAALLVAAGDNADRIRSEAAWAHMCGVAPIPASSGKTTRHRLNRGGNRAANHALWTIALVRMAHHQPTRTYVQRRLDEGLTKREIMRCLKRYIARETYHHLPVD